MENNSVNKVFYVVNDKEYCDEELALSILLKEGILFCNERRYAEYNKDTLLGSTIVLYVICNDIFAWGCADAEDLPLTEVPYLYKLWEGDNKWGSVKWCCSRRKEKPQFPIIEAIKKDNSWNEIMENLPENRYDAYCNLWLFHKKHP